MRASATCLFDQTRQTRLFWRVCRVFSTSSSPHPFPSSPHFRHVADALLGVCNVSFSPHATNMPVSACPSCFPVLPPGRHENASHMGRVFVSSYIPSPPEHQHAHLGALVVFGRFSTAGHSLPIRTPPTYPNGHISGVRLLVFHPNPSLQTDMKMRPIWARFRVCCLHFPFLQSFPY